MYANFHLELKLDKGKLLMEKSEQDLLDLYSAIQKAWSRETSFDGGNWNMNNPAWGQGMITALVVQDFFGGHLLRMNLSQSKYPVVASLRSHYLNRIPMGWSGSQEVVDLTKSQFEDQDEYNRFALEMKEISRECLLSTSQTPDQEKLKEKYKLFRLKVAEILSRSNPIFRNPIYQNCLSVALDSNCQRGKYGCIIMQSGDVVATSANKRLEALKGWCVPECVRKYIPARTESMIGECAHAEEFAIAEALIQAVDLKKCDLYVAGFRSNGNVYIKDEPEFTCLRCAVQIYIHKVGLVWVPTVKGWAPLSTEECVKIAKKYALQEKSLPQQSPK